MKAGKKHGSLLEAVLKKITPTGEEHKRELKLADTFTRRLSKFAVKPVLAGSMAKGTDLRGEKDIDIFIMFPEDVSRKKLEERGLEIGRKVFEDMKIKYGIDYAEHPYVKGYYGDYTIEIVPCYMGAEIKSSVDRTPFHTRYVRKKIRANKRLVGEIRLLKQFMRGIGVYGAEAKVEGFSGYLVEVLTINYGSFLKVLEATSSWRFGQVIDTERLWGDATSLEYFFTDASLIVVDPVDANRNVAAAVSKQRLAEFIIAAKEFLENPSEEYFFPLDRKPKSREELLDSIRKRGTKILGFLLKHEQLNENSLYSQIKRTATSLTKEIHEFDFRVFRSGFWTDEENTSIILLEFEVWSLPEIKHHLGPPIDQDAVNQESFVEKYKSEKPYIKDGRWVVDTKRRYKKIDDLIPKLLRERRGFGKNLRHAEAEILEGESVVDIKDGGYLKFLSKFL